MVDGRQRLRIRHGRDWNAQFHCPLDDLGGRVAGGPGTDHLLPLAQPRCPSRQRSPSVDGSVQEVEPLDEHQEVLELLAGVGVEADPTVGSRFDGRGLNAARRRSVQGGAASHAGVEIGEEGRRQRGDLLNRHVDHGPTAAAAGAVKIGRSSSRGIRPGHPLHHLSTGRVRREFGDAAAGQCPAVGLQGELGTRTSGIRTRQSVWADGDDHGRRIGRGHLAWLAQHAARRGQHHISRLDPGPGIVDNYGTMTGSQVTKERSIPPVWRGAAAGPLTQQVAGRRFEEDHVAPGLPQQRGAIGRRQPGSAIHYSGARTASEVTVAPVHRSPSPSTLPGSAESSHPG